jgi:stalled ribosome rescue protein Dom34
MPSDGSPPLRLSRFAAAQGLRRRAKAVAGVERYASANATEGEGKQIADAAGMTASHHRVAVWLDHHEAHFFRIESDASEASTLPASHHHVRRHPDRNAVHPDHPDDMKRFFREVAAAVDSADEILVVGPSTAKLQFVRYVNAHAPKLEPRIVGVETVDHPTDAQFAALARRYFCVPDRMTGLAR